MRALQKSTGKTAAEIEGMLQRGELTAEYIKPFINAMGELATANGAYEKALVKLGTVESRMKTNAGLAAARMGEAGFTQGLIKLYSELIRVFQENGHAIDELGKVFNVFFRGVSAMIRFFEPLVQAIARAFGSLARVIEYLNDKLGSGAGLLGTLGILSLTLKGLPAPIRRFGLAFASALAVPLAKLALFIGLIDEVRAFFDADVIGLFDDKKWTKEQREEVARRRRAGDFFYTPESQGMGYAENKIPFNQLTSDQRSAIVSNEYQNVLTRKSDQLRAEGRETSAALIDNFATRFSASIVSKLESFVVNKYYEAGTLPAGLMPTQQNTITINVDGSKDPVAVSSQIQKDLGKILMTNAPMGVR